MREWVESRNDDQSVRGWIELCYVKVDLLKEGRRWKSYLKTWKNVMRKECRR